MVYSESVMAALSLKPNRGSLVSGEASQQLLGEGQTSFREHFRKPLSVIKQAPVAPPKPAVIFSNISAVKCSSTQEAFGLHQQPRRYEGHEAPSSQNQTTLKMDADRRLISYKTSNQVQYTPQVASGAYPTSALLPRSSPCPLGNRVAAAHNRSDYSTSFRMPLTPTRQPATPPSSRSNPLSGTQLETISCFVAMAMSFLQECLLIVTDHHLIQQL